MDLKKYREEIDAIDNKLLDLFFERMNIASEIAEYKKSEGIAVFDRKRESEKLESICRNSPEGMSDYARQLYLKIFELSRKHQGSIFRCGLLGEKLGHSFSPEIHSEFGRYSYDLFECSRENLGDFIRNGEWDGLNVTIPYKKEVLQYCDRMSETVKKTGSVNTLVRRDGCICGYNTDYYGFEDMIRVSGAEIRNRKVVVLGSGGASASVCAVLRDLGASDVVIISRNGENSYSGISRHADARILVNTTPVGMYPDNGKLLVDLDDLPDLEYVFDIVYNPLWTKLIIEAEKRKISCMNGLHMLVAQARKSSELFTGDVIDEKEISRVERKLAAEMSDIVLIGMPGCGKSTVARLLGKKLNRQVYETDELIEKKAGMTIPEIFESQGESGFRKIESEVLAETGKMSGVIISTGGGCVTVPGNYELLHQNGEIIWIERDTEKLSKKGRPLSIEKGPEKIYAERKKLYEEFADYAVSNNASAEKTAEEIERLLK